MYNESMELDSLQSATTPESPNPANPNNRKWSRWIIFLLILCLVIGGLVSLVIWGLFFKNNSKGDLPIISSDSAIKQQLIESPGKILEIKFKISKDNGSKLEVIRIEKKNGYTKLPTLEKSQYSLVLEDKEGRILIKRPFNIPNRVISAPPINGQFKEYSYVLNNFQFIITTLWFDRASTLVVIDDQNRTIFTQPLENISSSDNKPDFKIMINPQRISLIKNAYAASRDKLNITFVSNNYSILEMDKFRADVSRFSNHLLSIEPFSSRRSQIQFNFVETTDNLGCQHIINSFARLIYCDNAAVWEVINNTGAPTDVAAVIDNYQTYGGSGGDPLVAYNGDQGPQIFTHELGHTFAYLDDEYDYAHLNTLSPLGISQNCFDGQPPNGAWSGVVELSDYFLGCNFPNWYRSSETSIMKDITAGYFNKLSQKWINYYLDKKVGRLFPSADISPTNNIANNNFITPPVGNSLTSTESNNQGARDATIQGPPPAGLNEIEKVFRNIISVSAALAFIALLVMLVWAGIKYLTSGGEPKMVQTAHQTVTWALLGVLFMVIAWLVLQLIAAFTGIETLKIFDVRVLCGGGKWCS